MGLKFQHTHGAVRGKTGQAPVVTSLDMMVTSYVTLKDWMTVSEVESIRRVAEKQNADRLVNRLRIGLLESIQLHKPEPFDAAQLIAWICEHPTCGFDWAPDDDWIEVGEWQGNRNDRQFVRLGQGPTPVEAILDAIKNGAKEPNEKGE